MARAGFTGLGARGAPWIDRGPRRASVTSFRIPAETTTLSHVRVGGHQGGGGWMTDAHAVYLGCGAEGSEVLTARALADGHASRSRPGGRGQ